ncbi:MAG: hypothetical protein LBO74_04765 [Candidatus Symbiothrix sp.]|jgi:hypothetical protein|nr:hypothetical protein [Candidatus Symbiothrix sp.]
MSYSGGTHIAKWQWDEINDPAWVALFDSDEDAMINKNIHLALTSDGTLMDAFYILENGKESNIPVTLMVENGHYTINKIKYNGHYYVWSSADKCFLNGSDKIIVKKDDKKPNRVNLFKYTGEGCNYEYLEINWSQDDEKNLDVQQLILSKIQENAKWVIYPYTERDISCENNFTNDKEQILSNDRQCTSGDAVTQGDLLLQQNLNSTDPVHLVNVVNSVCLSSLRKLSYDQKMAFFEKIASQKQLKDYSELALLRLMNALDSQNYKDFYTLLEKNNNQLLKHLIDEMDDASLLFWTGNNYSNFIGASVTMFNQKPESIADRWNISDDNFVERVINLNPVEYSQDVSSVFAQSYTDKHNKGEYDSGTGNITLYDVYSTTTYGMDIQMGGSSVSTSSHKVKFAELSPLTPVIIIPNGDKLPLVQTALDGYNFGNGAYIVPAIFLKYNADKIRNDYIEKGIITTLDIATITASGGVALATKVTWVRRAWAMMEVAGAVGDLAINTQTINPNSNLGQAVDIYNLAMGIVGVKNVGKGVVNFAKELPASVKTLINENKSIKSLITSQYLDWQIAVKDIDKFNINDIDKLAEQEQVWQMLQITDKTDDYINFLTSARRRAITSFGKEAENLIYIKFNADGGAAAEIIDHFGQEGLNALKKVNNIQDVASELVKEKMMYRYINENTFGFADIKATGTIQKAPIEFPTYVTTERYTSGSFAKDKLQLPGTNEPTWIIEFESTQIFNDIKFPLAKWNKAEYIEVTCKSYPLQGTGGGIQFITNSQIKIKRMTNFQTGETINF